VYPVSEEDDEAVYTVTVTIAPASSAKEMTAFAFAGVDGRINGGAITVYVPKDTDLTGTPEVTVSQYATYAPAGEQTFTDGVPVTYTVTAQDGTTKDYIVTVSVLPDTNLNKALYVQDANKDGVIAALPTEFALIDDGIPVTGTIEWNTDSIPAQSYAYETIAVNGTFTADDSDVTEDVTSIIEVVPRGLKYFIDSGSMYTSATAAARKPAGSLSWNSVSALVGEDLLNNDSADKTFGDGTWGYTTNVNAASNNDDSMHPVIDENTEWYKVPDYTDKYNYGWFSKGKTNSGADDAVIQYDLTLSAGDYMLTSGTKEYWPSTAKTNTRPYKIEITDADGNVLATTENAIVTPQNQPEGTEVIDTLFFTLPEDGVVSYKMTTERPVSGGSGNASDGDQGHELSWLAVAEQGVYSAVQSTDNAEGLKTATFVENYTPNVIAGSGILAVYDDGGRLVSSSSEVIADIAPFSEDAKGARTVVNEIAADIPAGYTAKVFVWDQNYVPLSEAQTVS
jgi:hypothetical protein